MSGTVDRDIVDGATARPLRVVMIGEPATHEADLRAALTVPIEVVALPPAAADDAAFDAQIDGADVLVAMRFLRPEGAAPAVDLLHVPGAGLDRIAFSALRAGTVVCNAFEHEIPIAEYVLLSMLQHEIQLSAMATAFDSRAWSDVYRRRVPHGELYGKTLGIVGFGRIAQMIAERARAFGMRVVALDKHKATRASPFPADSLLLPSQAPELLAMSDFVVLACPLNDGTRGLIDAAAFARMKRSAVLINVARAPVVDEDALYEALSARRIAAAYLDVWYAYPVDADDVVAPSRHRFETLDNAICTPHSAAWTAGLFARRYAFIGENLNRLARGERLLNVVHGDADALRKRLIETVR